jgi:hypothetical protein
MDIYEYYSVKRYRECVFVYEYRHMVLINDDQLFLMI